MKTKPIILTGALAAAVIVNLGSTKLLASQDIYGFENETQSTSDQVRVIKVNNPEVGPGKVGYIYKDPFFPWVKSGYVGIIKGPNNYGWTPYSLAVIEIDIQPQTFDEEFQIVDSNSVSISFQAHAILRPDPEKIQDLVEHFGGIDWYKRKVQANFKTFVREAVGAVNSQTMAVDQTAVQNDIEKKMKEYLKGTPVICDSVVVGSFTPPKPITDAAAEKQAAIQRLATKSTLLEGAKRDAEIEVARAEGIRKAQDLIQGTLTDPYIKHEMVQSLKEIAKEPGNVIIYVPVGQDGLPIVTSPNSKFAVKKEQVAPEEHQQQKN